MISRKPEAETFEQWARVGGSSSWLRAQFQKSGAWAPKLRAQVHNCGLEPQIGRSRTQSFCHVYRVVSWPVPLFCDVIFQTSLSAHLRYIRRKESPVKLRRWNLNITTSTLSIDCLISYRLHVLLQWHFVNSVFMPKTFLNFRGSNLCLTFSEFLKYVQQYPVLLVFTYLGKHDYRAKFS